MKKIFTLLAAALSLMIISLSPLKAQSVAINIDGTTAHGSAILDIKSITKGMLAPRMTTAQRTAIATPAAGLLVYDTDTNSFWFYNGSAWSNLSASGMGGSGTINYVSRFTAANTIGNSQLFDNGTNVGIGTITPASKLHIKGSADVSQLIIDANSTQNNSNPLIKLRNSGGTDLMWIHSDDNQNVFVGLNAGRINNAAGGGGYNTFIGSGAGYTNTTGGDNTANGNEALYDNTTGFQNTANGKYALRSNTEGYSNTANGVFALFANKTASQNTAIGSSALQSQSYNPGSAWVSGNTAVGYEALNSNQPTSTTNGINNTAVGNLALRANTTGWDNTAVGVAALYTNNIGRENTALGRQALFSNTTGIDNTATGYKALRGNNGSFNTANGAYALESITGNIGDFNTANGAYALQRNSTGYSNTANGGYALNFNTFGNSNTANGVDALISNTTASRNTAIGVSALSTQSFDNSGTVWNSNNVAVGYQALRNNQPTLTTNGLNNAAVGSYALNSNLTGSSNAALGYGALYNNSTGYGNTGIGQFADVSVGGLINATAIGNNTTVNADNKIRLGSSAVTVIEGQVAFTPSDGRFKKNIKENVPGLDFITSLKPVTYQYQCFEFDKFLMGNNSKVQAQLKQSDYAEAESMIRMGFIAQDVERIIKEKGYKLSVVHSPTNPTDNYSIAYGELVVPLVKAVQEQQSMIEKQQQQIDFLLKRIEALEKNNSSTKEIK